MWQYSLKDDEKVNNVNNLMKILTIEHKNIQYHTLIDLLNCLYSIKFKKVIGYNYPKLLQVLHQFLQKDMGADPHFWRICSESYWDIRYQRSGATRRQNRKIC